MRRSILILEDDLDRQRRFSAIAETLDMDVQFWHSANEMIAFFEADAGTPFVISLDCDLIPPDGSEIWGDGIQVAEYLSTKRPLAPVIVHSTNRDGSRRMMTVLDEAGWTTRRVAPIGDEWIERDWRADIESLM